MLFYMAEAITALSSSSFLSGSKYDLIINNMQYSYCIINFNNYWTDITINAEANFWYLYGINAYDSQMIYEAFIKNGSSFAVNISYGLNFNSSSVKRAGMGSTVNFINTIIIAIVNI